MSRYAVEIVAKFGSPQLAGKFANEFEKDTGYPADREGTIVRCVVHNHGDEFVMRERVAVLGGDAKVKILEDNE